MTVNLDRWKTAQDEATRLSSDAQRFQSDATLATTEFEATNKIGHNLSANIEGRVRWLELLKAVNAALPHDPAPKPNQPVPPISEREQLHITKFDCQHVNDVSQWYNGVKQWAEATSSVAGQPGTNLGTTGRPCPVSPHRWASRAPPTALRLR